MGKKFKAIRLHKSQNFHYFKGKSRCEGKIKAIRLHKSKIFSALKVSLDGKEN